MSYLLFFLWYHQNLESANPYKKSKLNLVDFSNLFANQLFLVILLLSFYIFFPYVLINPIGGANATDVCTLPFWLSSESIPDITDLTN